MSDTPNNDDVPELPDGEAEQLAVQPIALQDEMERSFLDYDVGHHVSCAPRRARRPQARASPDHLGHGGAGSAPTARS
ncbi:MAG: hypothetical protein R2713_12700 [Ilumatobacteraceae bacterium]